MSGATNRRQSASSRFARELSRAVAARGRLDVVFMALSDHWTMILQKLFPVWVVMGPGLADPGHIELRRYAFISARFDARAMWWKPGFGPRHHSTNFVVTPKEREAAARHVGLAGAPVYWNS